MFSESDDLPSWIRQFTPVAIGKADRLTVEFEHLTAADAVLCLGLMIRQGKGGIGRIEDSVDSPHWKLANSATDSSGARTELWFRHGGFRQMRSDPHFPEIYRDVLASAPAGVTTITAITCNGLSLAMCGLAIECNPGQRFAECLDVLSGLMREVA